MLSLPESELAGSQAESVLFGRWTSAEGAHTMLRGTKPTQASAVFSSPPRYTYLITTSVTFRHIDEQLTTF
jgi:hypothetical protein